MMPRLFKLSISLLLFAADYTSSWIAAVLGRPRPVRRVVIYYHAVRPAQRARFARQMDDLMRVTTPVHLTRRPAVPSSTTEVVVTFDDGFVSVVEEALPELRRRGIPCTIFIPTGCLGQRPSWLERVHPDGNEVVMSASLARSLAADVLVQLGSHSVVHPNFRLLDDEAVRRELALSKADLERVIGGPVATFSFPYGAWDERSVEIARQVGYSGVFTIEPSTGQVGQQTFRTGRTRIDLDDWRLELRLKALGSYRWLATASALKRRMLGTVERRHERTWQQA